MLKTGQKEIAFIDTPRGILKLSSSAMAGDVIRALVELITNSDDSYSKMEEDGQKVVGSILIEVDRTKNNKSITVRDRAGGMTSDEWREKLQMRGNNVSGFDKNANVRGTLGFGVKDLVGLGAFEFESIKDGKYSCFAVDADLYLNEEKTTRSRPVTPEDKRRLGVRRSGSSVTVHLKGKRLRNSSFIENQIRGHYELRLINQSPNREIRIQDSSTGNSTKLQYHDPVREKVYEEIVPIPGYPDTQAHLDIFRNAVRDQSSPNDPARPAGIRIQGRKAFYENTLFSFESNPTARQFSGHFQCGYIDQLGIEYDNRLVLGQDHPDSNEFDIISPNRQGLEKNHPFRKAIQKAVEPILKELINKEEAGAAKKAHLTRSTRENLSNLGRALAKQFDRDLQEVDQNMDFGSVGGKDVGNLPDISLIPAKLIFDPNQKKTLSVRLRNKFVVRDEKVQVKIDADPPKSLEILDTTLFKQHKTLDDFSVAQVRLKATADLDYALIEVTAGELPDTATAEAEIAGEYEELLPVEEFGFEHRSVRCKVNQKKRVSLFIPVDILDKEHPEPHVTVDDSQVFSVNSNSDLLFDEDLAVYEKVIDVEGRQLGATSIIRATLGKHRAQCQVKVGQSASENSINLVFLNEKRQYLRAETEETTDGMTIKIMGGHPITKLYLGEGPVFPNQETKQAEIVAAEASEQMLERVTRDSTNLDGTNYNVLHREYMDKYLRLTHRFLVTSD